MERKKVKANQTVDRNISESRWWHNAASTPSGFLNITRCYATASLLTSMVLHHEQNTKQTTGTNMSSQPVSHTVINVFARGEMKEKVVL